MKRQYRFLVLVTDAYGGRGGIAEFNRHMIDAMCSWERTAWVVAVPVRAETFSRQDVLPERLTYPAPRRAGTGRIGFACRLLSAWRRHGPFDAVLCGHLFLLRSASAVQVFSGAPMAGIIHGIDAWSPPRRLTIRRLVPRLDRFVSVSEFTRRRFLEWSGLSPQSGTVIPNCVDLQRFTPAPPPADLIDAYGLHRRRVLLTVARLDADERYKGIDEVLDVMPDLLTEMPEITYLVVGDGTDLERLRGKARNMGLNDSVRFAGFVPEERKTDYYRLAHAFVMPGKGEGFGIVYLEAMACGIPVVASSADASREAVRNGQLGQLADPGDPASIRNAIRQALDAPRGERPKGLEYFSRKAFGQRFHAFLDGWLPNAPQYTQATD